MTGWDNTDLRALRRIGVGLGAFQVIEVKENSVTEQAPENDVTEDEAAAWAAQNEPGPFGAGTYPELPSNPHNHVYTWSPKLPDGSMLVIRANTAAELASAAEALVPVSGRLRAAWQSVAGGPAPAPQAPAQAWQTPQTPPPFGPNVSAPQAPGYVGPPAPQQMPQQQGWGGAPQAPQGGFNGGGQRQGGKNFKDRPAPQGWYRISGQKAQVDAVADQFGIPKGDASKGGKYNFYDLTPSGQPAKSWYCAPEVAQAFGQFNPVVG